MKDAEMEAMFLQFVKEYPEVAAALLRGLASGGQLHLMVHTTVYQSESKGLGSAYGGPKTLPESTESAHFGSASPSFSIQRKA